MSGLSKRRDSEDQGCDSAFKQVVAYFLDHEKPKGEPARKPTKKPPATGRKKPSTKAKKRGA